MPYQFWRPANYPGDFVLQQSQWFQSTKERAEAEGRQVPRELESSGAKP